MQVTTASAAVACSALLATTAAVAPASATARAHHPGSHARRAGSGAAGGTLTVLENRAYIGDWTQGLDPATGPVLALGSVMNAIYGELFEIGTHNRLVDDLAAGYRFSNGNRTLTVQLRHGVHFTDGTPFDAAAVVYNIKRDLAANTAANPAWPHVRSVRASSRYAVTIAFAQPDGAAVNQFQNTTANWIASPTAIKKEGETRFRAYPVGAGPFEMVSDTPTTKLVLKRNPHYWQKGHPLLKGLVFEAVANDESALEVLQSGGAQAYQDMTTPQLVSGYRKGGFVVTKDPGVEGTDVQINALVPPFTSLKAREALYYATDSRAIDKAVYQGTCPLTESFTGPGGLFYDPKVPGYRHYDLAKAKALVRSLGGLKFTMYYFDLGNTNKATAEALQTMFEQAGMQVTLKSDADIASFIAEYNTHKWQVIPAEIGSWDPATSTGVAFRLASYGPFTGIKDHQVDRLIAAAVATANPAKRAKDYAAMASVLNKRAYTPFICSPATWDVTKKGVRGPGLTTTTAGFGQGPLVLWEDVSMK